MNIRILGVLLCLFVSCTYAQVGINTTSPQEKLHIAGANSTIRVDGLNNPNAANNLGGANLTPLSVNANGDLVVATKKQKVIVNIVDTQIVASKVTCGWLDIDNGIYANNVVIKPNTAFTATKNGLAEVNFNITAGLFEYKNTLTAPLLTDGRPRIVFIKIFIDNTLVITSSQSYTSAAIGPITGLVVMNGSKTINLTLGAHTYRIEGSIEQGDSAYNFTTYFADASGANFKNVFQIIEY